MTTTTAKTTEYTVTFHWVAESWVYEADADPSAPMSSSDSVTVTLPAGSSPWEVYSEADALDKGPKKNPDVSGWDADGMTIFFNDCHYCVPAYQIEPSSTWSDF